MYGQQDAYAQSAYVQPGGIYSPGGTYAPPPAGYMDPAYSAQQAQPMYGQQPYAGDPYGQTAMGIPSNPAMSPMTYDPGYVNYLYGMQSPPSPRRFVIQQPQRRKGLFSSDNILTVIIVCGALFLILVAMLVIVTVVVPRLTRKHHSGHKRRREFAMEHENVADLDLSNMDAPQVTVADKAGHSTPKHSAAAKHGSKNSSTYLALLRNVKLRTKG
ncbi:uncharacterized protein LOC144107238 [Amblyomma americanum]